jgi:hypothetical protein
MSDTKPSKQTLSHNQKEERWEEKKLKVLLEAASIAIHRARYVFIIINIMAVLIFAGEFNALLPWIRNSVIRAKNEQTKAILNDVMHRDLQIVSVPLLGLKFSAFDLTIIGSLAAMLLSIWFYYCVRREHLVIKEVYKIAKDSTHVQKRAYLYHGIAHYFVYTTAKREMPEGLTPQTTAKAVVKALFFVPAWLPLLIVLSDIISLGAPSEVTDEPGCTTLWCVLRNHHQDMEALIRMLIAISLSLLSLSQCWGAYVWDKATRIIVEKLQNLVDSDR